jgi:hypothetical protein
MEQEIMPAGGGDLQGPFCRLLPFDFGKVLPRPGVSPFLLAGRGRRRDEAVVQKSHRLAEVPEGHHLNPFHHPGFGIIGRREQEKPLPRFMGGQGNCQDTADRADCTVQGQFTGDHPLRQSFRIN